MEVIFGEYLLSSVNLFLTCVKIDQLQSEPYKKLWDHLKDIKKEIEKILSESKKNKAAKTTAVKSKYNHRGIGQGRGYGKPGAQSTELSQSSSPLCLDIASATDTDSCDDSSNDSAESPVSTPGKSPGQASISPLITWT